MMDLRLYSEQYRPEGNIDARAARRAIGRPHLDFWEVFLRETLQNSWDARLATATSIDFMVDGYFASTSQVEILRDHLFAEEPIDLAIHELLGQEDVPLLVVTDRRTKGLQGPTRADLATDEPTHFVDFVRNIGRAQDKKIGGGTYGFGKGVLYDASSCSTIVVYTRTSAAGQSVSRLIGIGLGNSYDDKGLRFTGRHWWGVPGPTSAAEPLTGEAADQMAVALGITRLRPGDTGTAIAIVGALATEDGETLESIVTKIAHAATRWAWPHMIGSGSGATINFRFESEGAEVDAPQPAIHPVYRHYAGAYRRATAMLDGRDVAKTWPWEDHELKSGRTRLGALVFKYVQREQLDLRDDDSSYPVDNIALMRDPRLVVRYLDIPKNAQGLATIGVFVADPALDRKFALSEPVAHDDWAPENLRTEKYERNPVRQALDKIRRTFKTIATPLEAAAGEDQSPGAVHIANALGDLLSGISAGVDPRVAGTSAEVLRRVGDGEPSASAAGLGETGGGDHDGSAGGARAGSGSRRRRFEVHARITGPPRLALFERAVAAVFPVGVSVPDGRVVEVTAEPRVVLDGGAAEDTAARPDAAELPVVLGWSTGGPPTTRDTVFIADSARDLSIEVWVSQPADTAVTTVVTARQMDVP